jgi:AraC-like DNA-binding protein
MPSSLSPQVLPSHRASIVRGEAAGSEWEMATRPLPFRFAPYVRDCTGYSERTPLPLLRREFPGPQVVVILELGPSIRVYDVGHELDEGELPGHAGANRFEGGFVAGLSDRFTITAHEGFQCGIQLNLTPIGARLVFGVPMHELTDQVVSLTRLLPARYRSLADRLASLPNWDDRFDALESVLDDRLGQADLSARTTTVQWAVRRIEQVPGDMKGLARELGYSQKHVISMFRDHVGVPPKLLARIMRFDQLMTRLKSGPPPATRGWAALAQELGFYDQAHLVREVKAFTGHSPRSLPGMLVNFDLLS